MTPNKLLLSAEDSFLRTFLAQSPVVIACVVVYIFASSASLRYWLAVQNAPALVITNEEADALKKQKRWSLPVLLLALSTLLVYFGVFYTAFQSIGRSDPMVDAFCSSIFFPYALTAASVFFNGIPDVVITSVHRNIRGLPVENLVTKEASKVPGLFYFLGIAVSLAAFVMDNLIADTVVFASILYMLHKSKVTHVKSIRRMTFKSIAYAPLLMLIYVLLNNMGVLTGRALDWTNWFMAIWIGVEPVSFISLCLRFDFVNHVAARSAKTTSAAKITFRSVAPPILKPGLGAGVIVPSHIPLKFPKPYYITSLLLSIFSYVALLTIITLYNLPIISAGGLIPIAALFIACFGVLGLATVRGETRRIWIYKEKWTVQPVIVDSPIEAEKTKEKDVPLVNLENAGQSS